jgi:hypothetical protein
LRLLADLADTTTLSAQLSAVFAGRLAPQTVHDPGRVLTDIAVMIADGGECISDIATLADQPGVFGPVASDTTCRRVLDGIDDVDLAASLGRVRRRARLPGRSGPRSPGRRCRPRWWPGRRCWPGTGGRCW